MSERVRVRHCHLGNFLRLCLCRFSRIFVIVCWALFLSEGTLFGLLFFVDALFVCFFILLNENFIFHLKENSCVLYSLTSLGENGTEQ